MKKIVLASIAAALAASIALPAVASAKNRDNQRGPRIERMIERFDTNGNNAIELEEISAQRTAMFNSVDADNSGSLNKEEFAMLQDIRKKEREAAREEMRAERQKGEGKGDGKMDRRHAGKFDGKRGEGRRHDRRGPSLERLDADNNGEISAAEFAAMEEKMFKRFDRNGDNKIDITDFNRSKSGNN